MIYILDTDVRNGDVDTHKMTPLLLASVKGHLDTVESLISQREHVSKQERIEALELLVATLVDKKDDFVGASKLWIRNRGAE